MEEIKQLFKEYTKNPEIFVKNNIQYMSCPSKMKQKIKFFSANFSSSQNSDINLEFLKERNQFETLYSSEKKKFSEIKKVNESLKEKVAMLSEINYELKKGNDLLKKENDMLLERSKNKSELKSKGVGELVQEKKKGKVKDVVKNDHEVIVIPEKERVFGWDDILEEISKKIDVKFNALINLHEIFQKKAEFFQYSSKNEEMNNEKEICVISDKLLKMILILKSNLAKKNESMLKCYDLLDSYLNPVHLKKKYNQFFIISKSISKFKFNLLQSKKLEKLKAKYNNMCTKMNKIKEENEIIELKSKLKFKTKKITKVEFDDIQVKLTQKQLNLVGIRSRMFNLKKLINFEENEVFSNESLKLDEDSNEKLMEKFIMFLKKKNLLNEHRKLSDYKLELLAFNKGKIYIANLLSNGSNKTTKLKFVKELEFTYLNEKNSIEEFLFFFNVIDGKYLVEINCVFIEDKKIIFEMNYSKLNLLLWLKNVQEEVKMEEKRSIKFDDCEIEELEKRETRRTKIEIKKVFHQLLISLIYLEKIGIKNYKFSPLSIIISEEEVENGKEFNVKINNMLDNCLQLSFFENLSAKYQPISTEKSKDVVLCFGKTLQKALVKYEDLKKPINDIDYLLDNEKDILSKCLEEDNSKKIKLKEICNHLFFRINDSLQNIVDLERKKKFLSKIEMLKAGKLETNQVELKIVDNKNEYLKLFELLDKIDTLDKLIKIKITNECYNIVINQIKNSKMFLKTPKFPFYQPNDDFLFEKEFFIFGKFLLKLIFDKIKMNFPISPFIYFMILTNDWENITLNEFIFFLKEYNYDYFVAINEIIKGENNEDIKWKEFLTFISKEGEVEIMKDKSEYLISKIKNVLLGKNGILEKNLEELRNGFIFCMDKNLKKEFYLLSCFDFKDIFN